MSARIRWLLNFSMFQIGWFACVLGGAHDVAVYGSLIALLGVALHVAVAARPRAELILVLFVALAGGAWDSVVVSAGLMRYTSGQLAPGLTAHWIIALWALFGTTLGSSMGWMRSHRLLPFVVGAAGGPMAYLAGYELGAVDMPDPTFTLAVQAVGWAVLVPVMSQLAGRLCSPPAIPSSAGAAGLGPGC